MRIIGALTILLTAITLMACPKPVERDKQTPPEMANQPAAAGAEQPVAEETTGEPKPAPGTEATDYGITNPDDASVDRGEDGAVNQTDIEELNVPAGPVETPPDGPGPEAGDAMETNEPDAPPTGPGPGPAPVKEPEWQDPLDASRVMESAGPGRGPAYEEPAPRVSHASMGFAGYWSVFVANRGGEAVEMDRNNQWVFDLYESGKCEIQLNMDGRQWNRNATWEYVTDELSISMGPGGRHRYRVERRAEDADIAVLYGDNGETLFALRINPDEPAPQFFQYYETTFGPMELRRSGQEHWKGTYGDPPGKVILRSIGHFLCGSWEQDTSSGFVVFELAPSGFEGVWWYGASTAIDGEWDGFIGN